MSLSWIHENPASWDSDKDEIVGQAPEGIFEIGQHAPGEVIAAEWWRVEEEGKVLGYGWMDCTWGDAEILLAVRPEGQGKGVGSFILDQLEREATGHGVNYLLNVVRESHPDAERITSWLEKRGFSRSSDGRLMRRVVHPATP